MTEQPDVQRSFVTVDVAEQTFGIAIERVREVFAPDRLTKVPLAPAEIAGVLNLRGRIVTAIDMRAQLGLPGAPVGARPMAIGIDHKGEAFALLVDRVGDVLELPAYACEATPSTLDPAWSELSDGVFRLEGRLLLVLDIDRALEPSVADIAA